MAKRHITPLTLRDVWNKLEEIDKKVDEQEDNQKRIYLYNFGITYVLLGLTIIFTVMAAIRHDLLMILITGLLAIGIGSCILLFSDHIFNFLFKKKKM
jgi:hypothetical protein